MLAIATFGGRCRGALASVDGAHPIHSTVPAALEAL